ncbi:MAG: glycosyltransferase family 4 protein [Deltaproteobacteria bacterium]|nr:glycosyltransferase family 4 protein [Deltaproteobacteria bacterium]
MLNDDNRPHVLLVSKPVVPPWNDSNRNLVRDLVAGGGRYRYHVLTTPGAGPNQGDAIREPVYSGAGSHSPGLKQNLSVFLRLLKPDSIPFYHFFFAPNRRTSQLVRLALGMKRRRRVVHTICSAPARYDGLDRLMFADRVVVLSEHTKRQVEAATARPVTLIPPSVPLGPPVSEERKAGILSELELPQRPLVLYAGDYQFSNAAAQCVRALPAMLEDNDAHFVFACRVKQEKSRDVEARLKEEVQALGLGARVSFFNEVSDMEALAAAVTLQVQPADSLYAKMDFPLVLLESMREGVPVVVSDYGPLPELLAGTDAGLVVRTGAHAALAAAVQALVTDPVRRTFMGEIARGLVRTRFSQQAMASSYEDLYDSLCQAGGDR